MNAKFSEIASQESRSGFPMADFEAEWTDDTLTSLLAHQAESRGDAPAVIHSEGIVSFGALAGRVERAAQGLAGLGIGGGDVVSVQLPNQLDFLVAYLAIARLGAVVSTIHMPYRGREAADLMRAARSKAYLGPAHWHDLRPAADVQALAQTLPFLAHVIAAGGGGPDGSQSWEAIAAGREVRLPPPPPAEAPFLLLFTSGTSSKPKGVRADYRRFMANARLNRAEMNIGPGSVMCSAAPYTHLLGLFTFHMTLHAGAATLLLPEFTPATFAAALRKGRPTHVFVAPAHIAACRAQGLLDRESLESVRYIVVSGASAPAALYRGLGALLAGGSVAQVWGMTELQCGIFHRPGDLVERVASSCGVPAPCFEARTADAEGAVLPRGAEGELQVRGISVFDGYFENAEATAAAFTPDGWFRTGDTAKIDGEGYVTITGRLKDVINRGGVKINPVDIEEAIAQLPAVAQCAIAPIPDPVLGERACAYVVLKPGATLTLSEVTAWLAKLGIAKIKWPERLELIAEMPLTPTRKVIKARLGRPVP
jgi:cyclohexanecarboxylate-CoA ligase